MSLLCQQKATGACAWAAPTDSWIHQLKFTGTSINWRAGFVWSQPSTERQYQSMWESILKFLSHHRREQHSEREFGELRRTCTMADWAEAAAQHRWSQEFFRTCQSEEWVELEFLLHMWSLPLGVKIWNWGWIKIPSPETSSNGITLKPWTTHATSSWSSTQHTKQLSFSDLLTQYREDLCYFSWCFQITSILTVKTCLLSLAASGSIRCPRSGHDRHCYL